MYSYLCMRSLWLLLFCSFCTQFPFNLFGVCVFFCSFILSFAVLFVVHYTYFWLLADVHHMQQSNATRRTRKHIYSCNIHFNGNGDNHHHYQHYCRFNKSMLSYGIYINLQTVDHRIYKPPPSLLLLSLSLWPCVSMYVSLCLYMCRITIIVTCSSTLLLILLLLYFAPMPLNWN